MLEIYNEQVRDLLSKDSPKGGLQVRQNPKLGYFYVVGLKSAPVGSYKDIEKRMEQGNLLLILHFLFFLFHIVQILIIYYPSLYSCNNVLPNLQALQIEL